MPTQDPLMPPQPGPFNTPLEPEYDHWDGPEIIVDPLSGFVIRIPPQGRAAPFEATRRAAGGASPLRDLLTRWLKRLGVAVSSGPPL
jgi:hypothetical protein